MPDPADYTAAFDQRIARMSETARLAAAFYKGLVLEGVDPSAAAQITAIYATTINSQPEDEGGE